MQKSFKPDLTNRTNEVQLDNTVNQNVTERNETSKDVSEADELSDTELEQVSGGGDGGSTWNP